MQVFPSLQPVSEQTGMPRTTAPVAGLVVISVNKDCLLESPPASIPSCLCEDLLQRNVRHC